MTAKSTRTQQGQTKKVKASTTRKAPPEWVKRLRWFLRTNDACRSASRLALQRAKHCASFAELWRSWETVSDMEWLLSTIDWPLEHANKLEDCWCRYGESSPATVRRYRQPKNVEKRFNAATKEAVK